MCVMWHLVRLNLNDHSPAQTVKNKWFEQLVNLHLFEVALTTYFSINIRLFRGHSKTNKAWMLRYVFLCTSVRLSITVAVWTHVTVTRLETRLIALSGTRTRIPHTARSKNHGRGPTGWGGSVHTDIHLKNGHKCVHTPHDRTQTHKHHTDIHTHTYIHARTQTDTHTNTQSDNRTYRPKSLLSRVIYAVSPSIYMVNIQPAY